MGRIAGQRRAWRWGLALLGAGLLVGSWAGCGTSRERYRVLSFFFDGVPDPDKPPEGERGVATQPAGPGQAARAPGPVIAHPPYAQGKCEACHGKPGTAEFTLNITTAACRQCHQKVPRQYAMMHGPVAAEACLWCHTPHESTVPGLLRAPSPDLCLQCHDRDLLPARIAEHRMATSSCLDCHVGHGSTQRYLLRAAPGSATQPATQPGTPPATQPAPTSRPAAEVRP